MAKRKPKSKRKKLEDKLDKAWSLAVRMKGHCEMCKKTHREDGKPLTLNAHHIMGRRHRATRWDLENGLCLCWYCHNNKAHSGDFDRQDSYRNWLLETKGREELDRLLCLANEVRKWAIDEMEVHLDYLEDLIDL